MSYTDKKVVVVGPGKRGAAACRLLISRGAEVTVVRDPAAAPSAELTRLGVCFVERIDGGPRFDLAVLDPEVSPGLPALQELTRAGVPVVSELELGFQLASCLCVAITGTNGKSTTADLLQHIFEANHRRTVVAGHGSRPVCSVIDESKELDFLLLNVSAEQLQHTNFRPAVAVLLNSFPDSPDRFGSPEDLLRTHARVFGLQQVFDWAIVHSDVVRRLKELEVRIPSKVITFSGSDSTAELQLDRGLVQSRLPNWTGPLLDLEDCSWPAHHSAENVMAALAIGHVLRLPLQRMVEAVKGFRPGPNRFELVAEVNGVQFINDSKATNPHALRAALGACRVGEAGRQNVVLIAGGAGNAEGFHDLGPLVSQRVKRAFLLGQAAEKIRAAWSLFTPCTLARTLLEAVLEAAKIAAPGDVVLLSPACSSFDQFQNLAERGEMFCRAVKSISWGASETAPHISHRTGGTS